MHGCSSSDWCSRILIYWATTSNAYNRVFLLYVEIYKLLLLKDESSIALLWYTGLGKYIRWQIWNNIIISTNPLLHNVNVIPSVHITVRLIKVLSLNLHIIRHYIYYEQYSSTLQWYELRLDIVESDDFSFFFAISYFFLTKKPS